MDGKKPNQRIYPSHSLCATSRMQVRPWSVVIVPPEGGLESRWDSRTPECSSLCFIHVVIKIVSGATPIESWNTQISPSPHNKTFVFKLFDRSGDLTGGSPSTSVTVYTKRVHVMSDQQAVSPLQTLGA